MGDSDTAMARAVATTANRLRLVQIDFADQAEHVRREYLGEEIKRALANILPGDRAAFLEELSARFPTWDARVEVRRDAQAASNFDAKELADPSFLTRRLIEVYQLLPEAQQRAVVARLMEAGIGSTRDWPQQAAQQLKSKLLMNEKDPIDALRLLDLTAFLAELATSLDQVVWATWKAIAPQANVRRPAAVQRTMGRFVSGDPNTSRGQIAQDVNKLRMLIAALIASVGQSGRFAAQYYKVLAPDEIKAIVPTGFMGSNDTRYWRKFEELWAHHADSAVVDAEIRKEIARYTEVVMGQGGGER